MSHRLSVPIDFLRAHRADSVMLLRIAAGVNAIEASTRLILRIDASDDSPAGKLCRVHCVIAAVGYLRELVKTIDQAKYSERFWHLVDIGVAHGVSSPTINEAKQLLSPQHERIGGKVLLKVRDKIGFHWDPQPFEAFIDDATTSDASLVEFGGGLKGHRIFGASADAVSRWFLQLSADGDGDSSMEQLIPDILAAQAAIGDATEAAIAGLFVEAGEDPSTFFIEQAADEA